MHAARALPTVAPRLGHPTRASKARLPVARWDYAWYVALLLLSRVSIRNNKYQKPDINFQNTYAKNALANIQQLPRRS
eukprot:3563473-Pleurochrysis_carterae.AAC.2